ALRAHRVEIHARDRVARRAHRGRPHCAKCAPRRDGPRARGRSHLRAQRPRARGAARPRPGRPGRGPRGRARRARASVAAVRAYVVNVMALLQALIAFLTRSLGRIVNAIFGWAVTALFGRTDPKQQVALSVLVAAAAASPVLLVGILFPQEIAFILTLVPM